MSVAEQLWPEIPESWPSFIAVCGTMKPSGWVMGYRRKWPLPTSGRCGGNWEKSRIVFLLGLESASKLSTLNGLSFWSVDARVRPFAAHSAEFRVESMGSAVSLTVPALWWRGCWSHRGLCSVCCRCALGWGPVCGVDSPSVLWDTPLSLSDPGVWKSSPAKSLFWDLSSLRSCFRFFFSTRSNSRRAISSGSIGSPLQVVGWELWAGRPGPFFVFSFLRHLARRFWNHT